MPTHYTNQHGAIFEFAGRELVPSAIGPVDTITLIDPDGCEVGIPAESFRAHFSPALPDRRTRLLTARVSPAEFDAIRAAAALLDLNVSELVRALPDLVGMARSDTPASLSVDPDRLAAYLETT
jgi:hypothetical protein